MSNINFLILNWNPYHIVLHNIDNKIYNKFYSRILLKALSKRCVKKYVKYEKLSNSFKRKSKYIEKFMWFYTMISYVKGVCKKFLVSFTLSDWMSNIIWESRTVDMAT